MPTVTQSRNLPLESPTLGGSKPKWTLNGVPQVCADSWFSPGDQTTTSYRTSRSDNAEREYESLSGEQLRDDLRSYRYSQRYDTGHEFYTKKREWFWTTRNIAARRIYVPSGNDLRYHGALWPEITSNQWPIMSEPSDSERNADGTRAMKASIPTAPEAGLAQFLGELREGLPKIPGVQLLREGINPKSIGSEHLNNEFGIKPVISDLQKFASSILDFNKKVQQFRRDSDKPIRRRMTLREDRTITDRGTIATAFDVERMNSQPMFSELFSGGGFARVNDTIETITRFSGAFQYHLAQGNAFLDKMDRYEALANHVLGTRFTPSTFWELSPWTWLSDWFFDVGSFMSNISYLADDNLVMRYGYVMHEIRATRTRTVSDITLVPGVVAPTSFSTYHNIVVKMRKQATPYGFGINVSGLNPKQWSILGALGMTDSSTSLRRNI